MIIRRLIVPLTFAAVALHAGHTFAQGAVPAPPPGQAAAPTSDASPVPFPSNGTAPIGLALQRGPAPPPGGASDACMTGFVPLREEAEERGKLIKAAGERHAPPEEACKLIGNFGQSEIKMIKYIEANSARCGIPQHIADQFKAGHKNTEATQKKVCDVAQQAQRREPAGPVGDFPPFAH